MNTSLNENYFSFILVLSSIALIPFLFISGPGHYDNRSFHSLWNLGHLGLYACITCYLVRNYSPIKSRSFVAQTVILIGFCLLSGFFIELIQANINRSASINDILRNLIGTFLSLTFFSKSLLAHKKIYQWTLRGAAIAFTVLATQPLITDILSERHYKAQLPILANFEHPKDVSRFTGGNRLSIVNSPQFKENSALKVSLHRGSKFTGVALRYFPKDWSKFKEVSVKIFNPTPGPLSLISRLHDTHHNNEYQDRINGTLLINPGWNRIQINFNNIQLKSGRQFDVSNVAALSFFMSDLQEDHYLIFDDFHLHP